MLNQVLSIISPQHGGTFIDCTFGGGGYSEEILKYKNTKVFALDRDRLVIKHADYLKEKFPKRFIFFKDKFSSLEKIIQKDIKPKAIIFDLGLSSLQLSDQERGFSFKSENSLSMEMGINKYSAYDVVNHLDKKTLTKQLEITAETKDGLIMGIQHKKFNIHGVQFHPESIKTKLGIKILKNFIDLKNS